MSGNHLVPTQLKMSPFRYALYNIVEGINGYNKPTEYVDGYKTYVEMRDVLDRLVEEGEVIYDG
jgi:hypothetical protein